MFLLQPFVVTNEAHLGNLQRGAGLAVTLDGRYVFLVASEPSLQSQGQEEAEDQYVESYEESEDWKEQDETEEERQKEPEENDDYDSGVDTVAAQHKGREDYSQESHEETTTEIGVLEESEREGATENREKPHEDKNDSEGPNKESFDENREPLNESGSVEDKTSGKGNAKSSETGSVYDKSVHDQNENGEYHS